MSQATRPEISRRRMFAGAGTAGALAATAVALPLIRAHTPTVPEPAATPAEPEAGYRLSEHVQRYYQTARV